VQHHRQIVLHVQLESIHRLQAQHRRQIVLHVQLGRTQVQRVCQRVHSVHLERI